MIVYHKLWETMKQRGVSEYKLNKEYKISFGMLDKLRKKRKRDHVYPGSPVPYFEL